MVSTRSTVRRNIYASPATSSIFSPQNAVRLGRMLANSVRSYSRGRSMSRTPSTRRSTSSGGAPAIYGGGATKPYSRQYRTRKRSRRVRRRASKYYKNFSNALRKVSGVAFQKAIINGSRQQTSGVGQAFLATHLFSYNSIAAGVVETGTRDIKQIRDSMTNTFYTDDVNDTTKFMIDYGILDCTLFNNGNARLEVDLYHIVYNDNCEYGLFSTLISGGTSAQASLTSTAADKVEITDRGATLFDLPTTISVSYMKILSKEKIFLGVGDTYNFQYKSKAPFSVTKDQLDADNTYFVRKGKTHTFVAVFKSVVGDTGDLPQLSMGSTRTYGWRVDGQTQPGTAILAE